MSSLYQSRWADPPPPAAPPTTTTTAPTTSERESKQPDHEPAAAPSPPSDPEPSTAQPQSQTADDPSHLSTPAHTLSASATSFSPTTAAPLSPALPPPDVSTSDEFAQTGGQEADLFDDSLAPAAEESMQTRPPDDLFGDDGFEPVQGEEAVVEPVVEPVREERVAVAVAVDGAAGRGRGRGRGGRGRGGRRDQAQTQTQEAKGEDAAAAGAPQQAPDNAPTGPKKETIASVRGDRRGTGGVRKPKLSETELAEKMAAISVRNAARTAAHARAEADAASFAEREQAAKTQAAARAKEERRDRQQMMGERERNRLRKLKALEGREWDMEKSEGDFEKGGRFDGKPGGFAGDREGWTDGREYLYREPRERRGGGGAARGGQQQGQSAPPRKEDFPSLPPSKNSEGEGKKKEADPEFFKDAANTGKSWADQVESSG